MLASILASIALGAINPMLGSGALMASLGGFAQNDINFVRSNEKEADRIGIDVLAKAGLDPRGMANFFQKMRENARYYYTANIPSILRTHPIDEERIAEAENRTAQMKPVQVADNLAFQLFKELIRTAVITDEKRVLDYYERCLRKTPQAAPCRYGYALELIKLNRFVAAETQLQRLTAEDHNNLYYIIALAEAQIGAGHTAAALEELDTIHRTYPDNYAVLLAYSEALAASGQATLAVNQLTQATRLYPHDLVLCKSLAQAHANNQRKDYAYFTEAQCYLLQGQSKEAKHMLKQAAQLAKHDRLLSARIEARQDELTP
jgi:predicted Zn-dependent protease